MPTFRSLGSYLTKGLASSSDGVCDVCGAACDAILACGHGVHRACVANAIDEGKPETCSAPFVGYRLFPGLRRKPRRPRPEAPPSQPQAVAALRFRRERSAFDVPRSPPPRAARSGSARRRLDDRPGGLRPASGGLVVHRLGRGDAGRARARRRRDLAATSLLETGSVFTLSNAAPMSPSSRARPSPSRSGPSARRSKGATARNG